VQRAAEGCPLRFLSLQKKRMANVLSLKSAANFTALLTNVSLLNRAILQ